MQEQEGGRRGVGEKNKRRTGGEGRERGEKEEKSTESNAVEKRTYRAQTWERGGETLGNFAYLLYPRVSTFNPWGYARRKVPRLRNAKDTAKPSSRSPNNFLRHIFFLEQCANDESVY